MLVGWLVGWTDKANLEVRAQEGVRAVGGAKGEGRGEKKGVDFL